MPIEIRELVIRAIVGPVPDEPVRDAPAPRSDGGHPAAGLSPQAFDQLVQACVRQVMAQLARERER